MIIAVHTTPPHQEVYFHHKEPQINLWCCLYNNINIKDNVKKNINNNTMTTTTRTTTMTTTKPSPSQAWTNWGNYFQVTPTSSALLLQTRQILPSSAQASVQLGWDSLMITILNILIPPLHTYPPRKISRRSILQSSVSALVQLGWDSIIITILNIFFSFSDRNLGGEMSRFTRHF